MADFKFYPGQPGGDQTLSGLARYLMDKPIQNAGVGASPFGSGFGTGWAAGDVGMGGGVPVGSDPMGGYSSAAQPGGSYNPYAGVDWGNPAVYNATPLGQSISQRFGGAYDPNIDYGSPEYYNGPAGQAAMASPGIQGILGSEQEVGGALQMAAAAGPHVPGSYGSAAQPGGSYNPYAGVDYNTTAFPGAAPFGGSNIDLQKLFGGTSSFPGMTGLFGGGT